MIKHEKEAGVGRTPTAAVIIEIGQEANLIMLVTKIVLRCGETINGMICRVVRGCRLFVVTDTARVAARLAVVARRGRLLRVLLRAEVVVPHV